MAFYNEIFVEENGKLNHIGSCLGSDTPSYFFDVKSLNDWENQLNNLKEENGFYPHNDNKHPFPWRSYKTSDNLIVLRKSKKQWFEFWKPSYLVWVDVHKYDIDDENKSYFIVANKRYCIDEDCGEKFNEKDLIILEFPPIKNNL